MNNEQIFKIIESKVKMKGDTELNFYLNKVKKENIIYFKNLLI